MTARDVDQLLAAVPQVQTTEEHLDDGILLAYRRGALSESETARVEAHLADCEACRALLRELAAPVPEALLVWADKVDVPPAKGGRVVRRVGVAGVVLAAAAAVLLTIGPARPGPL